MIRYNLHILEQLTSALYRQDKVFSVA